MKKILFHSPALNFRGVTNSIVDFAIFNQSVLGNESAIVYNPEFKIVPDRDVSSRLPVIDYLKRNFKVLTYTTEKELNKVAEDFDLIYTQDSGLKKRPFVTSTRSCIHAVFQYYEPYGDRYAYISEWLTNTMSGGQCPFVPLIIDFPRDEEKLATIRKNFRQGLGITDDMFVIGRLGGALTFDLEFVHSAIKKISEQHSNIRFLLANTYPHVEHPNIIYLNPFFGKDAKSGFIYSCDAMIHGRQLGESFGLSIGEGLFFDKPVLAWQGGFDRNHIELLKGRDLIYSEENIESKILSLLDRPKQSYRQIVAPYSGINVMSKFKSVFVD